MAQGGGHDHVLDHGRDADLGRPERRDGLLGLGDRHFLQQRDQVDDRGGRTEQAHDRVRLGSDRADPGEPCQRLVHVEELRDPAGWRRVQHYGVVGVGSLLDAAPDRLVDLAGQQYVAQPRRDRGREVDRTEAIQRLVLPGRGGRRSPGTPATRPPRRSPARTPCRRRGFAAAGAPRDRSAACHRRARRFLADPRPRRPGPAGRWSPARRPAPTRWSSCRCPPCR